VNSASLSLERKRKLEQEIHKLHTQLSILENVKEIYFVSEEENVYIKPNDGKGGGVLLENGIDILDVLTRIAIENTKSEIAIRKNELEQL
jgi:hypothetical protein